MTLYFDKQTQNVWSLDPEFLVEVEMEEAEDLEVEGSVHPSDGDRVMGDSIALVDEDIDTAMLIANGVGNIFRFWCGLI